MKNLTLGIVMSFSLALSIPSFAAITNNNASTEISDKDKDKDKDKKKKKSCCSGEGKDKKCSSSK